MTSMNRRSLLQGMIAGAGALALPIPIFAKAATVTAKAAVPFHYGWACVFARTNNGISARDIARVFHLKPTEAQVLMDRMVLRGVVTPPDVLGRAQPTKAWQPWDGKTPKAPTRKTRRSQSQDNPSIADRFRAVMAHVTQDASYGWDQSLAS